MNTRKMIPFWVWPAKTAENKVAYASGKDTQWYAQFALESRKKLHFPFQEAKTEDMLEDRQQLDTKLTKNKCNCAVRM